MLNRFFYVLIAILIAGCSADDANNQLPVNSANISGKWYVKGSRIGGAYEAHEHSSNSCKDFIDLQNDYDLIYNDGFDCEFRSVDYTTWDLIDTKLKMGGRTGSVVTVFYYRIVKLTNKELVLELLGNEDKPTGWVYYYTRR